MVQIATSHVGVEADLKPFKRGLKGKLEAIVREASRDLTAKLKAEIKPVLDKSARDDLQKQLLSRRYQVQLRPDVDTVFRDRLQERLLSRRYQVQLRPDVDIVFRDDLQKRLLSRRYQVQLRPDVDTVFRDRLQAQLLSRRYQVRVAPMLDPRGTNDLQRRLRSQQIVVTPTIPAASKKKFESDLQGISSVINRVRRSVLGGGRPGTEGRVGGGGPFGDLGIEFLLNQIRRLTVALPFVSARLTAVLALSGLITTGFTLMGASIAKAVSLIPVAFGGALLGLGIQAQFATKQVSNSFESASKRIVDIFTTVSRSLRPVIIDSINESVKTVVFLKDAFTDFFTSVTPGLQAVSDQIFRLLQTERVADFIRFIGEETNKFLLGLAERLPGIIENIIGFFQGLRDVFQPFLDNIRPVLDALKEAGSSIFPQLKDTTQALAGPMSEFAAAFIRLSSERTKTFLLFLQESGPAIFNALRDAVNGARDAMNGFSDTFGARLQEINDKMSEEQKERFREFWSSQTEDLDNLGRELGELAGELAEFFVFFSEFVVNFQGPSEDFKSLWKSMTQTISEEIGIWLQGLKDFGTYLAEEFTALWDSALNTVKEEIEVWKNFFCRIFGCSPDGILRESIQGFVSFVGTKFEELKGILTGGSSRFEQFRTNVQEKMRGAAQSVRTNLQDMGNSVRTRTQEMVSAARQRFDDFKNAAQRRFQDFVNIVRTKLSEARNTMSNLGSSFFNAGKTLIDRIREGAQRAAGPLLRFLEGLARRARDLWPGSPAKEGPLSGRGDILLAGRELSNRIARGIREAAPAVLEATGDLAGAMGAGIPGFTPNRTSSTPLPQTVRNTTVSPTVNLITPTADPNAIAALLSTRIVRRVAL